LTILSPYVPLLFQGEEWAASSPFQYFVDFSEDQELADAVAAGRKQEFAGFHQGADVPNPQDPQTFTRSKLCWEEIDDPRHSEMLAWYKQLVAVRRRFPALVDGRMERISTHFDEAERWLIVERENTRLVANLSGEQLDIELQGAFAATIELASHTGAELDRESISMPPFSIAMVVGPQLAGTTSNYSMAWSAAVSPPSVIADRRLKQRIR
jgi:maltooligosyltrehalose trehalohydrolase